jgi:hypothetical protein
VDPTSTTVPAGETAALDYEVVLDAGSTDGDWEASGEIFITAAPFPDPPSLVTITADVGGVVAAVTCPGGLPAPVLPGLTLVCTYVASLPDGDPRTTTVAVVDLFAPGPPVVGTADVAFLPPTEVDECVDVSDTGAGALGAVCASDPLPNTFAYSLDVGPFSAPDECGEQVVDNTASFAGTDTGQPGSASASATVVVECGGIEVDVDIKPGGDENPINLRAGGKSGRGNANVPVAILSTDDFDAATVDVSTVTLGNDDSDVVGVIVKKNGSFQAGLEDVDEDGDLDLVLHFSVAELVSSGDLNELSVELCLNGATLDGDAVHGCDGVSIVGG